MEKFIKNHDFTLSLIIFFIAWFFVSLFLYIKKKYIERKELNQRLKEIEIAEDRRRHWDRRMTVIEMVILTKPVINSIIKKAHENSKKNKTT